MAKPTTGIEIDGGHVRVVRLDGTQVQLHEFEGDTTADAIDEWLKAGKPKGDYVVAWSGRSVIREAFIPTCPDNVLPAVIMDVAPDVLQVDGQLVAGVVSGDPAPDGQRPALVGAIDADALSLLHKKLGKSAPVTLSTFSYTQDGIYLAVRASNVEMTLVKDGRVVATRFLAIDGIDTLSASISSGGDPQQKINAYADELVNEVRETQRTWARSDRFDASATTLFIHGLGADLPRLREKITNTTGLRVAEPPAPGIDLASMNGQSHVAYQAIVAATSGVIENPGMLLRSPEAERAAKEKATAEKRRSMVTLSVVAVAAVLALMAAPVVMAQRNLSQAEDRYNASVTEFNSLKAFDQLGHDARVFGTAVRDLDGNEPNWPNVLTYLEEKAPAGTSFTNLKAQFVAGRQVQVEISAQAQAGPFIAPAEWLQTLLDQEGIPYAWIESSSIADGDTGTVNVLIKMQLPDDSRFFYLSDNEWPPGGVDSGTGQADDDAEESTE